MPTRSLVVALFFILMASPALTQGAGQTARVRGTITAVSDKSLTVRTAAGEMMLGLPADLAVSGVEKRALDDITDGDFIGTTAVKDKDGQWRAVEVHIFPQARRGTGEGHRPWDLLPESTMTNAAVAGAVKVAGGRVLNLTYQGGKIDVTVTPQTAIVALVAGDRSLLVPGAAVFAIAAPGPDGKPVARSVTAETKGVKPPM